TSLSRCASSGVPNSRHSARIRSWFRIIFLFPFNSGRWLGANVVHHAVNPFYTVNDLVGDLPHKLIRKGVPVGCHAIYTGYSPQRHHGFVGALIAHYPYRLYGQQDSPSLPDLV